MLLRQYRTFNSTEKTDRCLPKVVIKTIFKNSIAKDKYHKGVRCFVFVTHWKRKIWNYKPFKFICTWKLKDKSSLVPLRAQKDMEILCVRVCACARVHEEQKDSHFNIQSLLELIFFTHKFNICNERRTHKMHAWIILLWVSAPVHVKLWVNVTIQRLSDINMFCLFIYFKYTTLSYTHFIS